MNEQLRVAVRNLSDSVQEWLGLSDTMREDLRLLLNSLAVDSENQMLRRSFARACWAYVEAVTFAVKNFMAIASQFDSERLTADDHAFLADQRMGVGPERKVAIQRDVISALDNVKRTFTLASRLLEISWNPDFGGDGWRRLRRSIQVRHRLTHPKSISEVTVSQADFQDLQLGVGWFIQMFISFETSILSKYGTEP